MALTSGEPQSSVFETTQGAAGSAGGFGNALAVFFGEAAGLAEELLRVFLQGADPKLFGALEVLIEVGAVAFKALGEAKRGPVGDFVEGVLVDGGVIEKWYQSPKRSLACRKRSDLRSMALRV